MMVCFKQVIFPHLSPALGDKKLLQLCSKNNKMKNECLATTGTGQSLYKPKPPIPKKRKNERKKIFLSCQREVWRVQNPLS